MLYNETSEHERGKKIGAKLYYIDAYKQDFTTKVIKQDYDKDGNLYVILNETAFYPTGGGQPHDTGTLNSIAVLGVEEVDEEIRHFIAEQLHTEEVEGKINWERRFDHMQQHAAQHILSAAFGITLTYLRLDSILVKKR